MSPKRNNRNLSRVSSAKLNFPNALNCRRNAALLPGGGLMPAGNGGG